MKFKNKDKINEKKDIVEHESAGGFVFHKTGDGELLVALLKKIGHGYYIPKGHLKGNETPLEAAVREVKEELCLHSSPQVLGKLCVDSYNFKLPNDTRKHKKRVHIFIFQTEEKYEINPLGIENFEVAKWVSMDKALDILVFDKENLLKAVKKYKKIKDR